MLKEKKNFLNNIMFISIMLLIIMEITEKFLRNIIFFGNNKSTFSSNCSNNNDYFWYINKRK